MPLVSDNRAQALLAVVQAGNPNYSKLSQPEKDAFLVSLKAIAAADTSYLTTNATIVPSALAVPPGVIGTVNVLAASSVTTAPGKVGGTGTLS